MGKVDVISAVFESFALIRAHYKEVALPLLVLILLSGAGGFGGSSMRSYGQDNSPSFEGANLANAMTGAESGLLALGGLLVAIVAVVVVAVAVLIVVSSATNFYVFEHFYAILAKKKIKAKWTERFGRLAGKSIVLLIFWLVVAAAVLILPLLQIWNALSALEEISAAGIIGALASAAVAFVAGILLLLLVHFALTPLWVYYVMEGKGLFDSVNRSVSLVAGNLGTFLFMGFIFLMIGIGTAGAAMLSYCCCLGWLVVPIASVFTSLLWGVTLMKVKLALDK